MRDGDMSRVTDESVAAVLAFGRGLRAWALAFAPRIEAVAAAMEADCQARGVQLPAGLDVPELRAWGAKAKSPRPPEGSQGQRKG